MLVHSRNCFNRQTSVTSIVNGGYTTPTNRADGPTMSQPVNVDPPRLEVVSMSDIGEQRLHACTVGLSSSEGRGGFPDDNSTSSHHIQVQDKDRISQNVPTTNLLIPSLSSHQAYGRTDIRVDRSIGRVVHRGSGVEATARQSERRAGRLGK